MPGKTAIIRQGVDLPVVGDQSLLQALLFRLSIFSDGVLYSRCQYLQMRSGTSIQMILQIVALLLMAMPLYAGTL